MCLQALPLCGSSPSGFEYRQNQNQPMADLPQCFLNNSPRVSPRHTSPNGLINKVRQTDLSSHRSMRPPKHFFPSWKFHVFFWKHPELENALKVQHLTPYLVDPWEDCTCYPYNQTYHILTPTVNLRLVKLMNTVDSPFKRGPF